MVVVWKGEGGREWTYMGGACWISPRNCESASSTFSRVTCRQGAVRTRAPSLSYESVSHPSKHVVRYSYQNINLCVSKQGPVHNAQRTHLCAIQEIVQFLRAFPNTDHYSVLRRSIQPKKYTNPKLTEDAICERIQRPSLSNLHIIVVSPPPSLVGSTRRFLEFFFVDEETGVIYELF